jgi:hypothetical protein
MVLLFGELGQKGIAILPCGCPGIPEPPREGLKTPRSLLRKSRASVCAPLNADPLAESEPTLVPSLRNTRITLALNELS